MGKINYKSLMTIPTSKNFSEIELEFFPSDEGDEGESFNPGDNGKSEDSIFSTMQADALLLELLNHLNDREKIILLYQIMRESGYNLNHEDCARTLSITREHYMFLLSNIKKKAKKVLILQGVT